MLKERLFGLANNQGEFSVFEINLLFDLMINSTLSSNLLVFFIFKVITEKMSRNSIGISIPLQLIVI